MTKQKKKTRKTTARKTTARKTTARKSKVRVAKKVTLNLNAGTRRRDDPLCGHGGPLILTIPGDVSVEDLANVMGVLQADIVKTAWSLGHFGFLVSDTLPQDLAVQIASRFGWVVIVIGKEKAPTIPELHTGVYEHYKGGKYQVLGLAGSSDDATADQLMVVYVCLYTDKGGPYMRVRSVKEFAEDLVEWPDKEKRPRFRYVGSLS